MIYLDHNSTTPIKPEAFVEMIPYLTKDFFNPSARYNDGCEILGKIEQARTFFLHSINASLDDDLYFVSCGSEANNWAIRGLAYSSRYAVITDNIEHHSILNVLENHCGQLEPTIIPVGKDGRVTVEQVVEAVKSSKNFKNINDNHILVSIMYLNNEIGTIQDIEEIGAALAEFPNVYFHVDAVQAYGKIPIDVARCHIDMLSTSSHKIGAPRGSGFLYVRKGVPLKPLIYGGQQENYMRAGTENVAAVKGFQKAAEIALAHMKENATHIEDLYKYFLNLIDNFKIINKDMHTFHNTISIDCGCQAASMLQYLDEFNIKVSSGSACDSRNNKPSHVLKAIGLSDDEADRVIRISLSSDNTHDELRCAAEILRKGREVFQKVEEHDGDVYDGC